MAAVDRYPVPHAMFSRAAAAITRGWMSSFCLEM
jgi:hypothetical protein